MKALYSRRAAITAISALLGGIAGCIARSTEPRVVGIWVVNQTNDHLVAEIQISRDGDVLAEQRVGLPADSPAALHPSVYTQASVGNISQGATLTAEILLDDDRAESGDFTADCEVDDRFTGDEVSFFVRDDFNDIRTGCTTEELSPSSTSLSYRT